MLVEAADRIMPEVGPDMAQYTLDQLRARGIEAHLQTRLESCVGGHVVLSDGTELDCEVLVWTAGVKPDPVVAATGFPLDDRGRIRTRASLRIEGHDDAWSAGDCAAVPDLTSPGAFCSPSAQHAVRQARQLGDNLAAVLRGEPTTDYRHAYAGSVASLGLYQGVAQVYGVKLKGFPAWFMHRTYHMSRMPTFSPQGPGGARLDPGAAVPPRGGRPVVDAQSVGSATMALLAVTVLGHDRPGIIADVTGALAGLGGNLEDSSMTRLRGHFAMTLVVRADAAPDAVEGLLAPLLADLVVSVRVLADEPEPAPSGQAYVLSVHGGDRPGIVSTVTRLLASLGGNVTDLTTRLVGDLYVMTAEVELPVEVDVAALQSQLADVARGLGVAATLHPLEPDVL